MKRMKQAKPYLFLAISCCFLLSHTVNSSTTSHTSPISCLPHQSSTLLQLKQEFASPHPKIFENWNHTKDCCYWDGVTCDAKSGQVVGLDLSSGGIHGPLSPNSSLFNLLHLQRLNLAGNNFSLSAIPSRFEQLSRLSHLNLSFSEFSGQVPLEISSLTELVLLDLSSQDYVFSSLEVDLARLVQNLTKLRVLHLDEVTSLSSSMPKSLYLDVAQNQLTGPIPQQRQFSTFPISSFEGNLGLCGPPLSKKCGKAEAPTAHHSQESESENGFGFGWKVVAVGYGCGFIVGMIIGYVIISRRPYWLVRTFGGFILR